jgi:polyhydroxyalkanoate synthesis regulator phasin
VTETEKKTLQQSLREAWETLERRIDEGVKSAVQRVRTPIVEEIAAMRGRVEKLQQRIEAIQQRRQGGPGARPPADGKTTDEPPK